MGIFDYTIKPEDMTLTPQALEQRRKLAQALQQQGSDYSPIKSPWQGLARVSHALRGAWEEKQADTIQADRQADYKKRLADALQGGDQKALFGLVSDPWAPPGAAQSIGMFTSSQQHQQDAARAQANADREYALRQKEFEWRQNNANQPQYTTDPYTGEPVWVNPSNQTVKPAGMAPMQAPPQASAPPATSPVAGALAPSQTIPAQVPPAPAGVSPKVWRDTFTREAAQNAAGKPPTEGQAKDSYYVTMGVRANNLLEKDDLDKALTEYGGNVGTNIQDQKGMAGAVIGPLANKLKSDRYKAAEREGRNFVAMIVRKESGAAVTPEEWSAYSRMYLPQPYDPPELITAKRDARRAAMAAVNRGLPPNLVVQMTAPGTSSAGGGNDPLSAADAIVGIGK